MGLDFISDPRHLRQVKDRQKVEDDLRMTKLKRNIFLKEQIIKHSRIDLLMREVLGYTSVKDFHLLMFYHNTQCYRQKEKQKWHLTLAPRGGGKCVSQGVELVLSNGDRKKIKDINVGDEILSLNDQTLKQDKDKVIAKVHSGKKKVYKLKLKSGREIISTLDHRFRDFNKWKKLSEFQVGERIAVPRNLKISSESHLTINEAKLLGYLQADGALKGNCNFTKPSSNKILDDFKDIVFSLGFKANDYKGSGRVYLSNGILDFLRKHDCDNKLSKEKKIPSIIFKSSNEVKAGFLNRFIDCDGHVKKEKRQIEIILASKEFIQDLQELLLHFDILSSFKFKASENQSGKTFKAWRLVISGKENVLKFNDKIGLFSKQDQLDVIVNELLNVDGNTNLDTIPNECKKYLKQNPHFLRVNHKIRVDNNYDYSRDKLKRVALIDNNDKLFNLSESDIFWDVVESIEYHNEDETYDIQTLKNHNFVAQNIYTHNSTVLTISKIILDILQNPNIRILIASKTDSNSIAFLAEIKQKIQSKKFKEVFGDLVGKTWNDGAIVVKTRTATHKEETVMTVGYTGALASKHFDKIYADDLVDEENSKTDAQRIKLYTWFYKILDPTLEPDGEMNVIGTRYHPDDLYGSLIDTVYTDKTKEGKVKKRYYIRIKSLIRKKNLPKTNKKIREHEKYISFWPEKFTVKFLLEKRRDQGTIIFNSQMQNDVEAMKGKIFKVDWFKWYTLDEIDINKLMIYQGVDLAIKQKDSADKFAHCTIGVDPKTLNIFVLDYYNRVTHYKDQKTVIRDRFYKYDPIRVAVEANGYQGALLQDMKSNTDLAEIRAVPIFTDTDKTMRAWKLSAYFERGQVFLLQGMFALQEHLLQMPDGRYKDLFDALDIAITTAFIGKRKERAKKLGLI